MPHAPHPHHLTSRIVTLILAAALTAGCRDSGPESAPPSGSDAASGTRAVYTAHRTATPIVIDGVMDDAVWESAAAATLVETNTGEAVPLTSTVRLLWDDTYLYAAFYCEDPDAWATYTGEDEALWEEEVVELFIDPDGNGANYYELEVNPVNARVDLAVINAGEERDGRIQGWFDWDFKGLRTAVHVAGDGKNAGTADTLWTVEMAIPFADMYETPAIPPRPGDRWRLNAYRIERGVPGDDTDDWYAALSPTGRPSFHSPWRFGILVFAE